MSELLSIGGGIAGGTLIGSVIALLLLHNKLRDYIRDAVGAPAKTETRVQDPLTVKPSVEYTTRESFHKHAELNRDEHTRIRHELDKRVGSLEKDHHGLAREVSGVQSTLAANGQTLVLIGQKLDTLILKMGEKL